MKWSFREKKGKTPGGLHKGSKIPTGLAKVKQGIFQRIKQDNVIRFGTT